MARLTIPLLLALIPFAPLHAQAEITEARLRAHIETLAGDDFEGRLPGTRGEAMAAEYIARHMAEYGLAPAADNDSYYQPVELTERFPLRAEMSFSHDGEEMVIPSEGLALVGSSHLDAMRGMPTVFAGYRGDFELEGAQDFGGGDLVGAAVFVLVDLPEGQDGPSFAERRSWVAARGASAIIGLLTSADSWDALREASRTHGRISLDSAPIADVEGYFSPGASTTVLELAGLSPDNALAAAASPDFRANLLDYTVDISVETRQRRFTAYNVAGRIEGGGDTDETVLVMAHHDHLGICAPEGAADRVCNGAVDNASGVAALLEVAREVAEEPRPERDVLFVATTAEEIGLLGAHALVETPIVEPENIVAALNLDTIAIAPAGASVAIIGRGMTPSLDRVVDEVAAVLGRSIDPDEEANAFIQRQDGWALTQAGVPSIMAGGSFSDLALLGTFLAGPYHDASDDLSRPIELGGAAEDAILHVALVRALADPARYANPRGEQQ